MERTNTALNSCVLESTRITSIEKALLCLSCMLALIRAHRLPRILGFELFDVLALFNRGSINDP